MEQYFIDKLMQSDNVVVDLFIALMQLVAQMHLGGRVFYISIGIATAVSIFVVWLMRFIVKHVNKEYQAGVGFSIGSFFSFSTTFLSVILLCSLQFTEPVVKVIIKGWELSLMADEQWSQETFRNAYENVKSLKTAQGTSLEDFENYPHPDAGGSTIPGRSDQARLTAIDTYLEGALDNFETSIPILSWILSAGSGTAQDDIYKDMTQIFKEQPNYDMSSAIAVAGEEIASVLAGQTGRIIILGSIFIILMFIFIQSTITGLLAWTALRKIKENF